MVKIPLCTSGSTLVLMEIDHKKQYGNKGLIICAHIFIVNISNSFLKLTTVLVHNTMFSGNAFCKVHIKSKSTYLSQ